MMNNMVKEDIAWQTLMLRGDNRFLNNFSSSIKEIFKMYIYKAKDCLGRPKEAS